MNEQEYQKALAELGEIAARAEDPSTGLSDIDSSIKRSKELISACRGYLRTLRDKADDMDEV